MQKVTILCVGKLKEKFYIEMCIRDRHNRRHLQVHTEIRRQHRAVAGEFFNVIVRVLPDPLKAIVI